MWRGGFMGLLNSVQEIPKADLLDEQKYAWLHGYPLMAVLYGTLHHHQEHLERFR